MKKEGFVSQFFNSKKVRKVGVTLYLEDGVDGEGTPITFFIDDPEEIDRFLNGSKEGTIPIPDVPYPKDFTPNPYQPYPGIWYCNVSDLGDNKKGEE